MGRLAEEIAVVTGSAGGIGFGIAQAFLQEGAKVCLNDVNETLLKQSFETLAAEFGSENVTYYTGSVGSSEDAFGMVEHTVKTFGTLTIAVNNAGGALGTPLDFEQLTAEDWDKVMGVNLRGTFLVSQAAVAVMKENKRGSIVNMSSVTAKKGMKTANAAYATSKGGIATFTRKLAYDVGQYGIRVNAIAPGSIVSGEKMRELHEDNAEAVKRFREELLVNFVGEPIDIANAAVFLASNESRYITGEVMEINGGVYMG
ncbi:SDR family oxidoreductase [Neobacillus cucumis]|uniref:SDR family NAD(P)-dependent oxidoreductase n=1 Tax=Neobacillus cucumis TaxID=1740721 RepID=UPI00203F3B2F|nr:SDR family NAD(P)-dependent oxidoreductase [Neobacillus cucumis]MCM3726305.1 SDR family oxidoreductase [Neobacillus cucumis]